MINMYYMYYEHDQYSLCNRLFFGILAVLRLDRSCSEDEVAQKLGFGSVEARRIQLKHWGVPEWMLDEAPANERSAVGEDRAHVVRPTCPLCGHLRLGVGPSAHPLRRSCTDRGVSGC